MKLSLHLIDLGYSLTYKPKEGPKALEYEFGMSAISHILSRNVDRETLTIDQEAYRAYGIGGALHATVSYPLEFKESWRVSPFVGVT